MKYSDLKFWIGTFRSDQLDMDVTVYNEEMDEYFKVEGIATQVHKPDVLDLNHPYLVFNKADNETA